MALKKKSLYRLSSFFNVSNKDSSPPPMPSGSPPPVPAGPPPSSGSSDGRLRPVSQQLPPRSADGVTWTAGHQRAVSQQLQPPPAAYGLNTLSSVPRKAISSDRLRPGTSDSRTTGLRPSPSTPNLLAPNAPYMRQHGSSPNLLPLPAQTSPAASRSSTENAPVFPAASDGPSEASGAKIKRRSALFGGKKHSKEEPQKPVAWVCTNGRDYAPYQYLSSLWNGQPVPELWNENGDTFIYLFPKQSGRGPSFKVDSQIFSSSAKLTKWAFGHLYSIPAASRSNAAVAQEVSQRRHASMDASRRQHSSAVPGTPPTPASTRYSMTSSEDSRDSRTLDPVDSSQPIHLYVPINLSDKATQATSNDPIAMHESDTDALVAIRNLIAFLSGQSLVATRSKPTFYHIFIGISQGLNFYEFSNLDGSTFGEVANYNFDMNVRELLINDVRSSREKTIEGIVLGEAMRSVLLYNEAFTHAVGRLKEIRDLKSPKYTMISNRTIDLLDRGSIDLDSRLETMTMKLTDFQFYGLFHGVLNSSSAAESKQLNFDRWKSWCQATRKWFLTYQRGKWGNWPPRVGKKNHLQTDGLNRVVLQELYADVCLLYDLLVDRTLLTTRSGDLAEELADSSVDIIPRTLRKVLAEYDRSTPPVLPPIPFDVPMLPKVQNTRDVGRKLKKNEVVEVLSKSYNTDTNASNAPILNSFRTFDADSAHGLTIENVGDLRCGQWLFLYAVLQTLPWLVVDAPALEHAQGVEYFLCVAPRSGVPWAREDPALNRNWYGVAGSDKIVSLPADVLIHGVEGTYRRSHCWARAEQWTANSAVLKAAAAETLGSALPPPPLAQGVHRDSVLLHPRSASRTNSPEPSGRRSRRTSVVDLGLEALPLPAGVHPDVSDGQPGRSRPLSTITGDPSITFDAILGSAGLQAQSKKKK